MTTVKLTFPLDTKPERLTDLLRTLVAEIGRVWPPRAGRGPLVIETWATAEGVVHRLNAPSSPGLLLRLASTTLPGLRLELDSSTPRPGGFPAGAYLKGPRIGGRLRSDLVESSGSSLLAVFSGVRGRETLILQWVVAPMTRGRPPRDEADRRGFDLEVVAAGRVAAWSPRRDRAQSLVQQIIRAFLQARSESGGLSQRLSRRAAADVLQRRPPLLTWPSQLTVGELVGLLGWPSGLVPVSGLARGASRLLPPPSGLPTRGPVVGRANWPGSQRGIRLGTIGRLRHLHVLGPTGVGKTTLLARLVGHDATAGAGMVIVDPLGDLTDLIAERLPEGRRNDLVIVDPTDGERPVGFNLLTETATPRAVEFIVGSMSQLFVASWGPRTADILRAGLLTLARNRGTTVADLPDLLLQPGRRMKWVTAVAHDSLLSGFWQWYDDLSEAERAHVIAPLMNKLRSWLLRPELVRTVCHPSGTLQFREVFTRRRIVILRLPKGTLGEEIAALIGSLLLSSLWRSVLARAAVPASRRRTVFLYLDEFQDYLRLPVGLGDLLSQARGMGVSLVVAHQYLDQLPDSMRREVLANGGSRVVFRLGAADARVIARDLEPHLNVGDLTGLGSREVAVTVALPDRVLAPVTGQTAPLPPPTADARRVRRLAAERFGRPIERRAEEPRDVPIGRKQRGGDS